MFATLIASVLPYRWLAIGGLVGALVLSIGVQTKRVTWAKAETQQVKDAWTLDRAQRTQVALDAATKYRAAETTYRENLKGAEDALAVEKEHNARTRSDLESANRARADSDERLRDALSTYAASRDRTPDNPGATDSERAVQLGKLLAEAIAIDDEAVQLETELAEAAESTSADVRALLKAWPKP